MVNEWLVDETNELHRRRQELLQMERANRKALIDAIVSPLTSKEEREKLVGLLISGKKEDEDA